jgi:aminoglycoside phosphotransferase (APT) family kinase protein
MLPSGQIRPSGQMLRWVVEAVGGGAEVSAVRALHGDQGPWLVRVHVRERSERVGYHRSVVLRSVTPRIDAGMVRTGAAALRVAEQHGLAAPRLLAADLDGRVAGAPATLETVVAGSTVWPAAASGVRIRAAGAALARLHAIALEPRPDLPLRMRPIAVDHFARDRREGRMATTPLLRSADERIRGTRPPRGPTVFVHGDVWPGNVAWTDDVSCALIDWKTAGVGDPGVDIGELRKQMAITYGPEATADVVAGWEQAAGRPATNVAYWDAVAALNTPTDLDRPAFTVRRDTFLRAAIEQI